MTRQAEPMATSEEETRALEYIDHLAARKYYNRMLTRQQRKADARQARAFMSVNGDRLTITDTICPHGGHYLLIVLCNGVEISEPLCPIVIGLRKIRRAISDGDAIDEELIPRLLEHAKVKGDEA